MIPAGQVARMFDVGTGTLAAWRRSGIGPKWHRISSRHVVYSVAELLAVLEDGVTVRGVAAARKEKPMLPKDLMPRTYIGANRAAGELGVSMSCLQKWRYLGVGPTPIFVSRTHVVYSLDEILAARKDGVRGIAEAIKKKKASLPTHQTKAALRAAVASRAASEARRRRREATFDVLSAPKPPAQDVLGRARGRDALDQRRKSGR